jgi:hypothetical protein
MKKRTKHIISMLTVAAFALFAVASTEEEAEQSISGKPVDFTMTARELFQAYDQNEVAADEKYEGKVLEISGRVDDIGKDITDTIYVTLDGGGEYGIFSVQCFFADTHSGDAAKLSKGDAITVKGLCNGMIGNVSVRGCSIVR